MGAAEASARQFKKLRRVKRRDLLLQLRDQRAGVDRWVSGDVVDRLLGIQRCALSAHFGQRIDQHAGQFQHPEFEHREQPDRAGADDRHVGLDFACHATLS